MCPWFASPRWRRTCSWIPPTARPWSGGSTRPLPRTTRSTGPEASIWLVRPATYLRLPRTERAREQLVDLDGATRDAEWHAHEGAWLLDSYGARKLNVLPAGRPEDSRGLFSGPIEQISGR